MGLEATDCLYSTTRNRRALESIGTVVDEPLNTRVRRVQVPGPRAGRLWIAKPLANDEASQFSINRSRSELESNTARSWIEVSPTLRGWPGLGLKKTRLAQPPAAKEGRPLMTGLVSSNHP